ncbi:hypothetical protein FGO68_gene5728 [Halteria grandinella]|uniref:Uncharacterized protein n=1 Tax=Halteria grandinella TaxID=5974 RepID=A0A8J8NCS9_HALGN|nr:hypothetical protein FGO68_gene5728 [Halteria grandinella]
MNGNIRQHPCMLRGVVDDCEYEWECFAPSSCTLRIICSDDNAKWVLIPMAQVRSRHSDHPGAECYIPTDHAIEIGKVSKVITCQSRGIVKFHNLALWHRQVERLRVAVQDLTQVSSSLAARGKKTGLPQGDIWRCELNGRLRFQRSKGERGDCIFLAATE